MIEVTLRPWLLEVVNIRDPSRQLLRHLIRLSLSRLRKEIHCCSRNPYHKEN